MKPVSSSAVAPGKSQYQYAVGSRGGEGQVATADVKGSVKPGQGKSREVKGGKIKSRWTGRVTYGLRVREPPAGTIQAQEES